MSSGINQEWEHELGLERPQVYQPSCPSLQYGANSLIRDYCGVRHEVPFVPIRWIHGWMCETLQVDHRLFTSPENEPPKRILVARDDEKTFLESVGIQGVYAVGLPFAYVPEIDVQRRGSALLVMPVHSLAYTTHDWRFDEYVDQIDAIRGDFEEVVVCVHPACIHNGYWAPQFSRRGYRLITGATATDQNALKRLSRLLKSFSHVTTNGYGSHIAYAAASGCAVSIYGTFPQYNLSDFSNDTFYLKNPGLLEKQLPATEEGVLRSHFPYLFATPQDGMRDVCWGRHQIGADCRPSPARMAELMGWTRTRYLALGIRNLVRRTFGFVDR
jgi:hypothetical protein